MSSLSPSDASELSLYSVLVTLNPGYSIADKNFTPKKYLMVCTTPDSTKPSGMRTSVVAWPNAWEPVAYE